MIKYFRPFNMSSHWLTQNACLWLKALIVAGVLLLSLVLPFKASELHLLILLGLVPGICIILAFVRWPALGIICAIVGGMIVPYHGPSGLNVTMIVLALLLLLWLWDILVHQREMRLISAQTMIPLLTFVVTSVFSFGVGQLPRFTFAQSAPLGAQAGGLAIFMLSAGAFLLVANQVNDIRWLKALTWTFLTFAALFLIGRLVPGLGPLILNHLFQDGMAGSLFWTWLVALAFSQAAFNRDLRWPWRLILGLLVLASFYVLISQSGKWKSGWMPPLASVVAIIWFRSWRVGVALALVGGLPAYNLVIESLAQEDYSVSTRLDAWLIMLEIIKANPILGLGFANYRWFTPLFAIRGWAVYFSSHHQYVDIVAQTGLMGLTCFFWFFWQVGRLGWRLRENVLTGFARAYIYGCLGGLVGTLLAGMLGDWVLPFFYNIGMRGFRSSVLAWLFLGGLVVIEKVSIFMERDPAPAAVLTRGVRAPGGSG